MTTKELGADITDDQSVIVPCPHCGSEGRLYHMAYPRWSEPYEIDCGPCSACRGTGGMEIETLPLEGDEDEFFTVETPRQE